MLNSRPDAITATAWPMPVRSRHLTLSSKERRLVIGSVDGLLGALACQAAVALDFWYVGRRVGLPRFGILFFLAAWPVALYCVGAYARSALSSRVAAFVAVAKALPLVGLAGVLVFFAQPYRLNRPSILMATGFGAAAVLAGRLLVARVLGHEIFATRAILIEPADGSPLLHQALAGAGKEYAVQARISSALPAHQVKEEALRVDGPVDELIVPSGAWDSYEELLEAAVERGWRVVSTTSVVEQQQGRVPLGEVDGLWYLALADRQSLVRPYLLGRRAADLAVAAVLALVAAPAIALAVLAIKATSPGPAFLRQRRVGEQGATFDMYKLRTMRQDAERDGPAWTSRNDSRVTRVGGWLRRTRIDEIPQVLNVLRGEMSLIGPRPERPEFVRLLEEQVPHYRTRLSVKPGITGWAQVQAGYAGSVLETVSKVEYDLYYVKNRSLRLDLQIAAMTLFIILGLRGR